MPLRSAKIVRILVLAANPSDTSPLRLDQEIRDIREALERAEVKSEVANVTAVRPRDLPRKLRKFRPTFVHFSGHGERERGILLENADGRASAVSGGALASLFQLVKGVKCVLLNSCYSRDQAEVIAGYVPYVIGMKEEIDDKIAIEFAFGFYQAIADGESIPSAFDYGKIAVRLANLSTEFNTPVLIIGEAVKAADYGTAGLTSRSLESEPRQETPNLSGLFRSGTVNGQTEPITSLEDLGDLSWREFEALSLKVVEALYRGSPVRFTNARYSTTEDRDGDAQYVLAVSLDETLNVSSRIWLEVKQRRQRNISKSDVVSRLVDAMLDDANKIILITNKAFSRSVHGWLGDFAARTGLQYQLIDGTALLHYSQTLNLEVGDFREHSSHTGIPTQGRPGVVLTSFFSLNPYEHIPQDFGAAAVTLRPDRPVYLIVEAQFSDHMQPSPVKIEARGTDNSEFKIYPWPPASPSRPKLASPSEKIRQCFLIWPGLCRNETFSGIVVDIHSYHNLEVRRTVLNSVRLSHPILAKAPLRQQDRAVAAISRKLDRWSATGEFFSALLIAPPGLGKSQVISRVRRRCHDEGIYEIFLDCESANTDVGLMRDLVRTLLPFSITFLESDLLVLVSEWLIQAGLRRDTAVVVAQDICGANNECSKISAIQRIEVAIAVLNFVARAQPLALIIEDLHKAAPSLLSFIAALTARLSASGDSGLLLVASTRPLYSGANNLRAEWLIALSDLSGFDRNVVLELGPPTRKEAREMLQASITALEGYLADIVIGVVGATPYALREALLLLLMKGCIEYAEYEGRRVLAVKDPTDLQLALVSPELLQATEQRLKLLLDSQPDWLRLFLLGGAAYGRRFPIENLLEAVKLSDNLSLAYTLETCDLWSILGPDREDAKWLEFDHDLVRESILLIGPPRSRRYMAKAMLDSLGSGAESQVQCRLAYQAGLSEICLDAAKLSKKQARAEGRIADIVELNQLTIQILDPDVAAAVMAELVKTGEQTFIDPALRSIESPRIESIKADDRLQGVLDLLVENIDCLATVGSGSSGATEAAISEARMIASSLHRPEQIAQLMYFEGRMWFERNAVGKATTLHQQAEALFSAQGCVRHSVRAENLIRYAICLRRIGQAEESIALLWRAAKHGAARDWAILNKVRSNLGASYLHTDWSKVRYHWDRQIRQAVRRGMTSRKVHGLANISFIDLFEGEMERGSTRAREALEMAEHLRLDNQILRLCLNLSIYSILKGSTAEGRVFLVKAEQLALRHRIGRRIWRVTSNFATVEELLGMKERAFLRDLQVLEQLGKSFSEIRTDGREILPLVNIVLRSRTDSKFVTLLARIPNACLATAQAYSDLVLAKQSKNLPGLLGNYCADLAVGPRFLLSE